MTGVCKASKHKFVENQPLPNCLLTRSEEEGEEELGGSHFVSSVEGVWGRDLRGVRGEKAGVSEGACRRWNRTHWCQSNANFCEGEARRSHELTERERARRQQQHAKARHQGTRLSATGGQHNKRSATPQVPGETLYLASQEAFQAVTSPPKQPRALTFGGRKGLRRGCERERM